ncbi:MAG: hypothetical protein ACOCVF_00545 [bacterium]
MKERIKIAIDIDEILRAKAKQFHRYYVEEFGEEGVPENPFTLDFFNEYQFNDITETTKILRDDIDVEKINAINYHEEDNGDVPVDSVLFNTESQDYTKKEIYNRFMYEDFVFEIFGTAPKTYRDVDIDFSKFLLKYKNHVEFVVISDENYFSIPPTLFFLSKALSRCRKYHFYGEVDEIKDYDFVITTNPNLINTLKKEQIIKLDRPYNKDLENFTLNAINLVDLTNNKDFEKIIKYDE